MTEEERELLLDAFDSNWIAPCGPHVDLFEKEFAEKVDSEHAVALSSGTAAIHLALILMGVQAGDIVLTSSFTFAATANAITYVNATPVFIDSEESTWNLDPDLLERALDDGQRANNQAKAVLAVDVLGQSAAYQKIQEICSNYDVPIIEDAAEALGATYTSRPVGSFGSIGCFSFNGNKIVTTGGGGMLTTNCGDKARRARFLASQACDPAPHYQHSEIGFNYRMGNLSAAIGRGQLRNLDSHISQRRKIFAIYQKELEAIPGISFMPEPVNCQSTRWLTVITFDPIKFGATTNDVRQALEREGIESRPAWKPMHLQPIFSDCKMYGGAICERFYENGLCLPSGTALTEEQQIRVINVVRNCLS